MQKIQSINNKAAMRVAGIILLALLLGVVIYSFFVLQRQTARQSDHIQNLEKRIATLEAANMFAEKQIKKDRYQAVFLANGQIYFGKITEITKDTLKLEGIYYLQGGSVDRSGNLTGSADVSLVKLGKELHGPEDVMLVERKNVSFWENLQPNSEVSRAIDDHESSGNQ